MNADLRISLNGEEGLYKIVLVTEDRILISPIGTPTISSDVSALIKDDMDEWIVVGSSQPYVIEFFKRVSDIRKSRKNQLAYRSRYGTGAGSGVTDE